jgi:hypothetical protein
LTRPTADKGQEGKTEVWQGYREVVDKSLEALSKAKIGYEFCMDHKVPPIIVENEFVKKAYIDIKNRGGYIKLIAEITPENIGYCKELVKFLELRHLSGIKGNFAASERLFHLCYVQRDRFCDTRAL